MLLTSSKHTIHFKMSRNCSNPIHLTNSFKSTAKLSKKKKNNNKKINSPDGTILKCMADVCIKKKKKNKIRDLLRLRVSTKRRLLSEYQQPFLTLPPWTQVIWRRVGEETAADHQTKTTKHWILRIFNSYVRFSIIQLYFNFNRNHQI